MSRALSTVMVALLLAAPARADVEPPAKPTVFLVVEGGLGERADAVQAALKGALPRVPKGFLVSVITGCRAGARYDVTPPQPASEADSILEAVARAKSCQRTGSTLFYAAVSQWTGGSSSPRHHLVLLTSLSPTPDRLAYTFDSALRRGFTVSVLSFEKIAAKDRVPLQRRGAGRVYEVAAGARLAAALRAELSWSRLSKAQHQALAAAVKEQERRRAALDNAEKKGILKVLGSIGSGSGGVVNVLGSGKGGSMGGLIGAGGGGGGVGIGGLGGIGVRGGGYGIGSSSKNPRLRRSESLLGSKLALTFRKVSCASSCDLSDVRRQLVGAARPLLQCLEAAGMTLYGREEVTVDFSSTGILAGGRLPAERCVQAWLPKVVKGISATLLVGLASSVE